MNGYNEQSDRLMEARAANNRRQVEASSSDLPPWLRDRKVKEAHLSVMVCAGDDEMADMAPDDYYEAMRQLGRVPESALYPQRPYREALERVGEAALNAKRRGALSNRDFALPGRQYPIDTPARARAALARGQANATAAEYKAIVRAVKRRYPNMDVDAVTKSK